MRRTTPLILACLLTLGQASAVIAGMPAPLPTDPERILRLSEPVQARLQTISFFLLVILVCAWVVQGLWNYLRRDFPRVPRLSYPKALAGVLLWGIAFVIVLAMISGARELMTPGAWQKQGFTYKLVQSAPTNTPETGQLALRRQQLEHLRVALWQFAATHNGRFPTKKEAGEISDELWSVPGLPGLRYLYVPGLSVSLPKSLLAYEPELDPEHRIALQTNGDIVSLSSVEISRLPRSEQGP
jgi:hypothetical protein